MKPRKRILCKSCTEWRPRVGSNGGVCQLCLKPKFTGLDYPIGKAFKPVPSLYDFIMSDEMRKIRRRNRPGEWYNPISGAFEPLPSIMDAAFAVPRPSKSEYRCPIKLWRAK